MYWPDNSPFLNEKRSGTLSMASSKISKSTGLPLLRSKKIFFCFVFFSIDLLQMMNLKMGKIDDEEEVLKRAFIIGPKAAAHIRYDSF